MMLRRFALTVLGIAIVFAALGTPPSAAPASEAAPPPPSFAPERAASARTGDVIVRFRRGTELTAMGGAIAQASTSLQASTAGSGLLLVKPQAGESVDDVVARLRANPAVEFAEPNTTVHATLTPNDTLYASSQQARLTQIGVPSAWDTTTGGAGTTVAVLDTGVDATHEDLSGRVLAGYNFVAGNTNAADDHWHGTFVAGIIAGHANNGKGIAGICWSCNILPVKVLDASGSGNMFWAAQGIDWAVSHGAKVINMSFGGNSADAGLQTAVNNAWSAGVVLVAASGNDDHNPVLFPAAFSNVVAVGSVNGSNGLSSFSNVGPELDLVAPGEGITSTMCGCGGNTSGYAGGSGTSFASPEVAGVAALLIGAGTTNNATVVSTMKSTATDLGAAGFDNNYGSGLVNAAAALGDSTPPTVSITSPTNGATVSGTVNMAATASDNVGVNKVRFWVDNNYFSFDTTAPYSKTWDTTTWANGAHTVKVEAVDDAGNSSGIQTVSVTVNNVDNTPPTVSITAPSNGATVSGTVNMTATASDNVGVNKVRFWVDNWYFSFDTTAPYSKTWDTTTWANGAHTVKVEALDDAGNSSGIQTVSVTVNNVDSTPPTVSITSPTNGATVSGTVNITATASDNVSLDKVRFWVDNTYLSFDTTAPYSKTWDTTTWSNGAHTVKVEAIDDAGNSSGVQSIAVTVSN